MSGEKKGKPLAVSYTTVPAELPKVEPLQTASQFQNQQDYVIGQVERIRKMFEESKLSKYIIMAGVSGVVVAAIELIRGVIQLISYIRKF